MSFSNHIAFDQIRDWPPGKIATLSVEELALLLEDLSDAKARLATIENKLRGGLDLKYGPKASAARKAAGKDTGTARVADGRFTVIADLPKRVKWDQPKLARAVRTIIEQWRDDPAQYVATEYKVSEASYAAWPDVVRKLFEPARTVEHGKPTFRIEVQDGEAL
ncbi:MAG: hypothetical protein ABTQ34_09815 [Bdellovibrionales bacterium]